jgi:hypothetical protein
MGKLVKTKIWLESQRDRRLGIKDDGVKDAGDTGKVLTDSQLESKVRTGQNSNQEIFKTK